MRYEKRNKKGSKTQKVSNPFYNHPKFISLILSILSEYNIMFSRRLWMQKLLSHT